MCEELKLIQTHLGDWKLEDLDIKTCSVQLNGKSGIYCIKNLANNKLLIGEGILGGTGSRLHSHIRGNSKNTIWKQDLVKYGKDNFRLIWIIEEEDEIKRKLIENKLQTYFKDNCYNLPRKEYPTQKELINNQASFLNGKNAGNIVERLNNYTKVQRDYIDECWETNYSLRNKYGRIRYLNKTHAHHILMYIYYNGDICGITSTIHHKCENKLCVNPEHLELATHTENTRLHYDTNSRIENINKLYAEGKSILEISNILEIHEVTARRRINFKTSSIYRGTSWNIISKSYECYECCGKKTNLGHYNTEIEAAQNRDYYIVKNNLLHLATLNFHNIDYYNFIPHLTRDGKINKNLL